MEHINPKTLKTDMSGYPYLCESLIEHARIKIHEINQNFLATGYSLSTKLSEIVKDLTPKIINNLQNSTIK